MYAVAFHPNATEPLLKMLDDFLCSMAPLAEGQFVFSKTAELSQGFLKLEVVRSTDTETMKVSIPSDCVLAIVTLSDESRKIGFLVNTVVPIDRS